MAKVTGEFVGQPQQNVIVEDIPSELLPILDHIDASTRQVLSKDYHIVIPYRHQITTIAYAYIKELFHYMRKQMETTGDPSVYVNFMDLLEFEVDYRNNPDAEKEGNLNLMVVPGYEAKLLIKSDALTEDN